MSGVDPVELRGAAAILAEDDGSRVASVARRVRAQCVALALTRSGGPVSAMELELTFRRAVVHPVHDTKRLEAGQDLNDALLDFFVKLGQAMIPEDERAPSVAYLGSHFYDVLRKGGVKDGMQGHKNVANWAKRRLGKDGLFGDGVGAFAVPVNEQLGNLTYDGRQEQSQEKHWWLALLLNPAGVGDGSDDMSMLCLDSFVRAEQRFEPSVRALKGGRDEGNSVEVMGLCRVGFNIKVRACLSVRFGTAPPSEDDVWPEAWPRGRNGCRLRLAVNARNHHLHVATCGPLV